MRFSFVFIANYKAKVMAGGRGAQVMVNPGTMIGRPCRAQLHCRIRQKQNKHAAVPFDFQFLGFLTLHQALILHEKINH